MTLKVLDAITTAIYNKFGDAYNIETDEKEQGFQEPCFFVRLLESQEEEKIMDRYLSINAFKIVYYPVSDYEKTEEYYDVKDTLLDILRYITTEDGTILRGTRMRGKVADNALTFLVNYDFFIQKERKKDDTMQTASITQRRG